MGNLRSAIGDFNPLPRKEGDTSLGDNLFYNCISIHSLVKRETRQKIHWTSLDVNFNPLPRKEGDDVRRYTGRLWTSISIHSLVKRETF